MLKIDEGHINKGKAPLLLVSGTSKKKTGKKGSKRRLNPKGGIKKNKGKKASGKMTCFFCDKAGHWKKNCKAYLAGLKHGASDAPKGMYEIHTILTLNSSISYTWILDTACGYHIYKSLQGLRGLKY